MTEREYRRLVNRQYRLPWQLERARDRLVALEAERSWSALNADGRVLVMVPIPGTEQLEGEDEPAWLLEWFATPGAIALGTQLKVYASGGGTA